MIFGKNFMYTVKLFVIILSILSFEVFAIPQNILQKGIDENIEYNASFDYLKLKKISNLNQAQFSLNLNQALVDHVIVFKSHKQMFLMYKNNIVKYYWIALSDKPVGPKEFEGDKKTPEGTYILDYIKPHSYYYKAFHISYPNKYDIARAKALGKKPGGMIMIHGQPPSGSEYHDNVQKSDWTNGCIAILNPQMDELISLVKPGTPITINP